MAHGADKHDLYEEAVQDPESEVKFVSRTFRKLRKRDARTLREDFAGTSVFSIEWARTHRDRHAWALDLDEPTLNYARERRLPRVAESVQKRVHLQLADVLKPPKSVPKVDVSVGFNFSYWCFKSRPALLEYFKVAHAGLVKDGLLFLDAFGGSEATEIEENIREVDGYDYRWDQAAFNPLTSDFLCHIHFDFPDGSSIEKAFTYDWRFWTLPEIRELLLEAGFKNVRAFFEKTDDDGDGTGRWYEPKRPDHEGVWWSYIVAER